MATSGKQLSSLPSASSIAGNNEFLTWVGNNTAQKVSRDDFIKSLPTYRQPSTAYTAGQIAYHSALPTGYYLECTTAGTTSSSALVISSPSIGGTVSDGTVVWRVNKYLAASGGPIINIAGENYTNFYKATSDSALVFSAGPTGENAAILLCGKDFAGNPGQAALYASDAENKSELKMVPDGRLILNDNDLAGSAIVAKSLGVNGYIKYASGLIVQWGEFKFTNLNNNQDFAYPISYTSKSSVTVTRVDTLPSSAYTFNVHPSLSSFSVHTQDAGGGSTFCWHAIGY